MASKQLTEPGFSDRPVLGRAFQTAMAVAGGIALIQILAIAWGILRREPSPVLVAQAAPAPAPVQQPMPPAPVQANRVPAIPTLVPDPPLADAVVNDPVAPSPLVAESQTGGPAFLGPAGEGAPASADAGTGGAPADLFTALETSAKSQVLADGILERLLVTGVELRASGNTQGALRNFREVESALPDHPRILSEIAATLGLLGLKEKSQGYWERVEALGAVGAGPYFGLASTQLGKTAPVAPQPAADGKTMKIGEVKVEEQATTSEGQRVTLKIVVDAVGGFRPVGDDLLLLVRFYDRGAGGEIRPTTADTSYLYPTEPYDWQVDGTETFLVNYLQPLFTDEQKRELGERTYYGYAIELYYRDDLQDKIAMPGDLASFRFDTESTESPGDASPLKPESGLFPNPDAP